VAKDAFDRWWEWVEKPVNGPLTIPAYLHDAVTLSPDNGATGNSSMKRCGLLIRMSSG
jgi:hypothetical protein